MPFFRALSSSYSSQSVDFLTPSLSCISIYTCAGLQHRHTHKPTHLFTPVPDSSSANLSSSLSLPTNSAVLSASASMAMT